MRSVTKYYLVILEFVTLCTTLESIPNDIDNDGLVVKLVSPKGKIRGHQLESYRGSKYYAFQDIPYAAPPIGNLRFKPPQKHDGWTDVLDTTDNTKVCPQTTSTNLPQNEDCLVLNVYSPVKPKSDSKLAVYVWIHGGGYYFWDGTFYKFGPQYLIDYDIVIVTFNYRLGAFGFLATDDGVIPGNLGLRDQNFALHWVQKNIHLFGGDPEKVTIGGESAGASSVGIHTLSHLSKGLFRGAILESGSALATYNYQKNPDRYAFDLGRNLNNDLEYGNGSKLLEILRKATVSEILEAQTKVVNVAKFISVIPDIVWAPTIETTVKEAEAFLYKPMHESFINGNWNKVPTLLGFSFAEMLWFLTTTISNTVPSLIISYPQLHEIIKNLDEDPSRLINDKWNILDSNKAEAGSLLKKIYTNTNFSVDKEAYIHFASDIYFNQGMLRTADLVCKDVPVYLYTFSYTPITNKSLVQGAEHTEELQYLWQNVEDVLEDVNDFQKILRHRMLTLWTNFIKYQNPTPQADPELDNLIWPTVNSEEMAYLDINVTFDIRTNPRNYLQTREIFIKFMKPPFIVY